MYTLEEFDKFKTKVLTYILYKKRTEYEVRNKFAKTIDEEMLTDIIEYLKEAGYINDSEYVEKIFNEYMNLKLMSIREIKNKIFEKGVYIAYIEDYISKNREILDEYELNSAKKIIDKKAGMEPQKLKAYMIKRGFNTEILERLEN